MSSWCHRDSPATGDCQQPPFPEVAQMCLQFAAPLVLSALRNSCWWQEGRASTPACPAVLRASSQVLLHHRTVSGDLLSTAARRDQSSRTDTRDAHSLSIPGDSHCQTSRGL